MDSQVEIAPLLVLTYNRPDKTRAILEKLRLFGVQSCFVSVDGPKLNDSDDITRVEKTISIIQELSAQMEISLHILTTNLGCYQGVVSGIDWFFTQVESGIILEDDLDFDFNLLTFLSEQLVKHKSNLTIGSISGFRDERFHDNRNSSQLCTYFPSSWGWATWSDRWSRLEREINFFFLCRLACALLFDGMLHTFLHWKGVQRRLRLGELDSWAYRWLFTHLVRRWKSIVPSSNLVTNLGFGPDATHTIETLNRTFTRGIADENWVQPISNAKAYDFFLLSRVYGYYSIYSKIKKRIQKISRRQHDRLP